MANEAYCIVQRKYFHVLMKVLSFFIAFSTIFYSSFASSEVKGVKGVIAPYGR